MTRVVECVLACRKGYSGEASPLGCAEVGGEDGEGAPHVDVGANMSTSRATFDNAWFVLNHYIVK